MNKDFLLKHPFLYLTIAIVASIVGYYLYDLLAMIF